MSKLDGNERWKPKMLLTQHREQYEQRYIPKVVGGPTKDELTMIRDGIMYPHIITMLDRALSQLNATVFEVPLVKQLLAKSLEWIITTAVNDQYEIKRELARANIKIMKDEINDGILNYHYVCRGYEARFGITREALRSAISDRMTLYTHSLSDHFRKK